MSRSTAECKERLAPAASEQERAYELIRAATPEANRQLKEMGWSEIIAAETVSEWTRAMYLDPEERIHCLSEAGVRRIQLAASVEFYRGIFNDCEGANYDLLGYPAWIGLIHQALTEGGAR